MVTAQAMLGILPRSASITGGKILFADPQNNNEIVDIAALDSDDHLPVVNAPSWPILEREMLGFLESVTAN